MGVRGSVRRVAMALAACWALPLALDAQGPVPGDPDGGFHFGVALGATGTPGPSGFDRCCGNGPLVEGRVGVWLRPSWRADVRITRHMDWSDTAVPGGPFIPRPSPLGPDTIRVSQDPEQFRDVDTYLGARIVREVRSTHGFALRVFGDAGWLWTARMASLALGGGMRFGPQVGGLGIEVARGAVPVPHRTTEWRYLDGDLQETLTEEGTDWAFPWTFLLVLDFNP